MEERIEGRDLGNMLPGSSRKGNRREDMGHHRRTMEDQGKVRWKARGTHEDQQEHEGIHSALFLLQPS